VQGHSGFRVSLIGHAAARISVHVTLSSDPRCTAAARLT
jgi:hypothetical protein